MVRGLSLSPILPPPRGHEPGQPCTALSLWLAVNQDRHSDRPGDARQSRPVRHPTLTSERDPAIEETEGRSEEEEGGRETTWELGWETPDMACWQLQNEIETTLPSAARIVQSYASGWCDIKQLLNVGSDVLNTQGMHTVAPEVNNNCFVISLF